MNRKSIILLIVFGMMLTLYKVTDTTDSPIDLPWVHEHQSNDVNRDPTSTSVIERYRSKKLTGRGVSDSSKLFLELEEALEDKINRYSFLRSAEATKQDWLNLANYSDNKDIVSAFILNERLNVCAAIEDSDQVASISAIPNNVIEICQALTAEMRTDNENRVDPFFIIENAALGGDLFSQYVYWRSLLNALARGTLDISTVESHWVERRDMAISWQESFAKIGYRDACSALSMEYYSGRFIGASLLHAIVYTQRSLEIEYSSPAQKFLDLLMEKYTGDEEAITELYNIVF